MIGQPQRRDDGPSPIPASGSEPSETGGDRSDRVGEPGIPLFRRRREAREEPPQRDVAELASVFEMHEADAASSGIVPSDAVPSSAVPPRPQSLADTGLTLAQLSDLLLKLIYLHGSLQGHEVSAQVRLPFSVIEESLTFLRKTRCIEVTSGQMLGQVSYRFQLTDQGRVRAREAFEFCRYVGPAPVSLRSYVAQCRRQTVAGIDCNVQSLTSAFDGLVLRPGLIDDVGAAVSSGQSLFLYGPAGNGKTVIARRIGRWLNQSGGDIYVPYSVQVDGAIITVFDPTVHQTTDDVELEQGDATNSDRRWRRIRRPVILTAGELTLEMLDLRPYQGLHFYAAPAHLKANGGVFLIDDFGRQRMSPRELLNRWILPLAERIDYLTLGSGKKFAVPFEQLVIFSTNLDPADLVDDAFLRRIRHKIEVLPPSPQDFAELFARCCVERGVAYNASVVNRLFTNHYSSSRPPRWSDPQDLLEIVRSTCRFRGVTVQLSEELIEEAAHRFFCRASLPQCD